MRLRGKMNGAAAMVGRISKASKGLTEREESAVYIEGNIEMTESKRRVPVKFGILRDSGQVTMEREGKTVTAVLSYGGAASDYAVPVHENLDAIHPVGQAKYLESVLNESRSSMAARIARRIKL